MNIILKTQRSMLIPSLEYLWFFFFLFWSSPEIRNSFTSSFTATLGKELGHSLLLRFHLVPVTTLGLLCMLSPLEFNVTLRSRYGSVHFTNVETDWNFKTFNIKKFSLENLCISVVHQNYWYHSLSQIFFLMLKKGKYMYITHQREHIQCIYLL